MRKATHSRKMKAKLLLVYLHRIKKNSKDQKNIKELVPLLKASSKKIHRQRGTRHPCMNIDSMVISIHVMVLVTRLWTVHSMEEEVLEFPITQFDAGLVAILAMLLQSATP